MDETIERGRGRTEALSIPVPLQLPKSRRLKFRTPWGALMVLRVPDNVASGAALRINVPREQEKQAYLRHLQNSPLDAEHNPCSFDAGRAEAMHKMSSDGARFCSGKSKRSNDDSLYAETYDGAGESSETTVQVPSITTTEDLARASEAKGCAPDDVAEVEMLLNQICKLEETLRDRVCEREARRWRRSQWSAVPSPGVRRRAILRNRSKWVNSMSRRSTRPKSTHVLRPRELLGLISPERGADTCRGAWSISPFDILFASRTRAKSSHTWAGNDQRNVSSGSVQPQRSARPSSFRRRKITKSFCELGPSIRSGRWTPAPASIRALRQETILI
jgi:hypothetical protein